jgi:UDP-glucose:(heptosyl)LPS alpha-1,3-glucosyltransferase
MKIALIRPKVGFGLGGAENYTASVAREFVRLGHEVTIVANYCDLSGVQYINVPIYGRGSVIKTLSFFLNVRRVLVNEKFDIVYTTWRFFPATWVRVSDPLHCFWVRFRYKYSFLQKIRPRHRLILWLEKQSLKQAERIIVNSHLVRRQINKYYSDIKQPIEVIYNGVDLSRFNLDVKRFRKDIRFRLNISPQERVLLFVGNDWKRKGLSVLLSVFQKLPKETKLIVCGGKKLGRKGRIFFLGQTKNAEDFYAAADLFVLPTRYDPFANVVLEAMACGLPAITTKTNGASEIIDEGITGFVTENSEEGLLNTIQKALSKRWNSQMIFFSVQKFSWIHHTEQLLLGAQKM